MIITVLTLAAIGAFAASVLGNGRGWHVWQIDATRSGWIRPYGREFVVMYFTGGDPSKPDVRSEWMGFGFVRGRMYAQPDNTYAHTAYAVFCPSWLVVVLLGGYPAFAVARGSFRRWRSRSQGRCSKCRYDLTGNVSGVCPECGTAVGNAKTQKNGNAGTR